MGGAVFLALAVSAFSTETTSATKSPLSSLKDIGAWLTNSAPLTNDTVIEGLKGGLSTGVDRALDELGKPNGFLQNAAFKILLPPELAKAERTLRKLKQDRLVDGLVEALNHAAEQSVTATVPIFKEAITSMTVADALAILKGPPDAATTYFRTASGSALRAKMLPLVKAATDANAVGTTYKRFSGEAAPLASIFGVKTVDLDAYVCDRAISSLFTVIATQEAALRANPKAAASKLIERVFSAAKQ